MKKIQIAVLILTLCIGTMLNAQDKRYEVKSGVIEYTISGGGTMMGVKSEVTGNARTVFKEWGDVELQEQTAQTTVMGQIEQSHEMTKMMDQKVYVVDFEEKVIYEYTTQMLTNTQNKDLAKTGKEMLKSMGAKKIGEEKFMGYMCEIWEMMGVKIWLYKGIMLKSEGDIMGMKHTTTATKIELDTSVSDEDLELPNFPIQQPPAMPMPGDNDIPQMSPEQMQQMQEMMKNFGSH